MNQFKSRRDFLAAGTKWTIAAAIGGLSVFDSACADAIARFVIGDGVQGGGDMFKAKPPTAREGSVQILERTSQNWRARQILMPFLPHGFCQLPDGKIWTFEKWNRHAAICDVERAERIRIVTLPSHLRFFGHGTTVGDKVFASVMNDKLDEGQIAVYTKDGKLLDFMFSGGAYPHDIQVDPSTGDILVLNSRTSVAKNSEVVYGHGENSGRSRLVWIDPKTGNQRKTIELGILAGGYAHFQQLPGGEFYLTGSGYDDNRRSISFCSKVNGAGKIVPLEKGHNVGESLSVAVSENGFVGMTFPAANEVGVWNEQQILIEKFSLSEPRGIWWDKDSSSFLVSSAKKRNLTFISVDRKSLRRKSVVGVTAGSGSHLHRLI